MKNACIFLFLICSMILIGDVSSARTDNGEMITTTDLGRLWRQQFEMPTFTGIRLILGTSSVETKLGERELDSIKTLVTVMKTVPETHLTNKEVGGICSALYSETAYKLDEELGEMVLSMLSVKKGMLPEFESKRNLPAIDTLKLGTVIRKLLSGEGDLEEQGRLFTQFIETQLITEVAAKRSGQKIKEPSPEKMGELTRKFISKYIRFKLSPSKSSYDKEFGKLALQLFEEGAKAKLYYAKYM